MLYPSGNTATGKLSHSCVVQGKKFLRNRTVREFHVSRWWRLYFNLCRNVRLENAAVGIRKSFAHNDTNGSTLNMIKWSKLIVVWTRQEMQTILHMRPNLGYIKSQLVFSELLSHSFMTPSFFAANLVLLSKWSRYCQSFVTLSPNI